MPVSRTSTVIRQRSAAAPRRRPVRSPPRRSSTSPCSVNLSAFDRRLSTIWRTRPASPTSPVGQVRVHGVHELHVLRRRDRREQVQRPLHGAPQLERLAVELHLAGLDLAEVEDVVDDGEQRVGGGLDRLGVVGLLGVEARLLEQPAHPDDRVHRRPDLVAHRREERGLRLVRLLGGPARLERVLVEGCVVDGDRRLAGEALEEREVGLGERASGCLAPDRHHADDRVARDHRRDHQPLLDVGFRAGDLDRPWVGEGVVDHLRSPLAGRPCR